MLSKSIINWKMTVGRLVSPFHDMVQSVKRLTTQFKSYATSVASLMSGTHHSLSGIAFQSILSINCTCIFVSHLTWDASIGCFVCVYLWCARAVSHTHCLSRLRAKRAADTIWIIYLNAKWKRDIDLLTYFPYKCVKTVRNIWLDRKMFDCCTMSGNELFVWSKRNIGTAGLWLPLKCVTTKCSDWISSLRRVRCTVLLLQISCNFLYNLAVLRSRWCIEFKIDFSLFPFHRAVTDPRDGRRVALKKLPNVFQSLVSSKRVFRELKMLCFFKHENVSREK